MYRVKTGTTRRQSRATQKRNWLANFLCLGAGVSFTMSGVLAHAEPPMSMTSPSDRSTANHFNDGNRFNAAEFNETVRNNPFVVSPQSKMAAGQSGYSAGGSILQTSDLQLSELRLKTIGTAVGLVPIGRPRPAQTILEISTPSESRIQVNPLANQHSTGLEQPVIGLVEDAVTEVGPPAMLSSQPIRTLPPRRSQARIVSAQPPQAAAPPIHDRPQVQTDSTGWRTLPTESTLNSEITTNSEVTTNSESVVNSIVISEVVDAIADAAELDRTDSRVTGSSDTASSDIDDGSFSFSMTDLDELSGPIIESANEVVSSSPATEVAEFVIAPPAYRPKLHASESPVEPSQPEAKTPQTSVALQLKADEYEAELSPLPLLPSPAKAWVASKPTADATQRYPERRRAHVEVAAPPMIPFHLDSPARERATNVVSSATIVPAEFAGFKQRKSEPSDGANPAEAGSAKSDSKTQTLVEQIRKTYPSSSITMSEIKGKLVVRGACADREEATEIIRLIRSKHLIPVDDQMRIR